MRLRRRSEVPGCIFKQGFECGIKLDGFDDVHAGDVIEAFIVEKLARALDGSVKRR